MKRFFRLLRKDLEATRWPLTLLSSVSIGLQIFVRVRFSTSDWPHPGVAVVLLIPFMFLPFWLFWQSFQTLRSEWREDTVYTLLILPIPGWQIILSKITAILMEYTVLLAVNVGGLLILFDPFQDTVLQVSNWWLVRNGLLVYLFSLAVLASFVAFVQLSFVVSKMVGRFQGLVALWTFVLSHWLVGKLRLFLEPLFSWLPPLSFDRIFQTEQTGRKIVWELDTAPQIGKIIGIVLVFALTSFLLEHYVEINEG